MNNIKGMSEKTRVLFEQFISEIQKESFAEGYEAGKLVGAVDSVEEINNKWLAEREAKTPNQQRAELIEKAKKFVEEKAKNLITCDFIVKSEERLIQLYSRLPYKEFNLTTVRCNPVDVFNEWIGKAIALARALQLPVPVEFLKAVQPSELVVGHVTIWSNDFMTTYTVNEIKDNKAYCNNSKEHWRLPLVYQDFCNIIEDTNAQYEVSK